MGTRRTYVAHVHTAECPDPSLSSRRAARGRVTALRELNPDFRDLLLAFSKEGVEFVVVGAHALALHGVPRMTGDLDVLTAITGVTFDEAWSSRESVDLEGSAIHFLGRD